MNLGPYDFIRFFLYFAIAAAGIMMFLWIEPHSTILAYAVLIVFIGVGIQAIWDLITSR